MTVFACRSSLCCCSIWLILALLIGCAKKEEAKAEDPKAAEKQGDETLPDGLTPEQAAKVVAKVGERTITVGDVTRQINKLSPYIRRRWAAPEKRKEFLEKLIRVELLSQEAERLGLGDDLEVQHTIKQTMVRLMVKNDLEKNLLPSSVDEETLRAEYEKAHDTYHRPEQIRASIIVLKNKAEAQKLLAEVQKNKEDSGYFRKKARELSIDEETKNRGGDLGYFSRPTEQRENEPEIQADIAEMAWKLKNVGDVAEAPIKIDKGFALVRLTNKREPMSRSFESVKRILESRVLREKRKEGMDKFIDGLRGKSKIELFPENIAKIKTEVAGQPGFPPVPGGHHHHDHNHDHGSKVKAGDKEVAKKAKPSKDNG